MTVVRRDAVIILARGEGARMGRPKAGLVLPGMTRTFLQMVEELYAGFGWPVTAVFGPAGRGGAIVPAGVRVLDGPSGGDTALTVVTAWKADAPAFAPPTHYWTHPVDVPLVTPPTVARLVEVSRGAPGSVIRPVFGGRPGHPVVVPRPVVRAAAADPDHPVLPFREFLDRHPAPRVDVAVADRGVTRDFDEPDDLAAWRPEGVTR